VGGNKVNLFTNYNALIYLNNQPKLTAKQAQWVSYLNLFDYTIKHRGFSSNKVADGLTDNMRAQEPYKKNLRRCD